MFLPKISKDKQSKKKRHNKIYKSSLLEFILIKWGGGEGGFLTDFDVTKLHGIRNSPTQQ